LHDKEKSAWLTEQGTTEMLMEGEYLIHFIQLQT